MDGIIASKGEFQQVRLP